MKYSPKPITEPVHGEKTTRWDVEFGDGGYIFDDQDQAMIFCLLLEIRDRLKGDQIKND